MKKLESFLIEGKLKFNPYKLFEVNNKFYLVTNIVHSIFEVDEEILQLLKCEGMDRNELLQKYNLQDLEQKLEEFEESFIIETRRNNDILHKKNGKSTPGIKGITLMVCQECNLRCIYCYGDGGEYSDRGVMNLTVGHSAVDYLFNAATKKDISIVFFGGEPLMQFPFIESVVAYANSKAKLQQRKVNYSITTNATLVNDNIAKFLADNGFIVTVSIDGNESSNNKTRYYINGKGAYKSIMNGVDCLKKYNNKLSARATVCPDNCPDLFDNLLYLLKSPLESVYFSPAINMMREEDYETYIIQNKRMGDYFITLLKAGNYELASKIKNISGIISRIHIGGFRNVHCGAGCNMLTVDINGEFYPCHRFVATKENSVGSLDNGLSLQKYTDYNNNQLLSSSSCSQCWAVALCGGGCPYENYQATEHINEKNTIVCSVMKEIYTYIVQLYLSLSDNEREGYFLFLSQK